MSGVFLGTNSVCPSVPGRTRKVATLVWKREDICSPHKLKYTESRTCSFIHKISTSFFWNQKHGPSYMALSRNGNLFPLGMAFRTLIRKVKNKLGSEGSMPWEASRNLPLPSAMGVLLNLSVPPSPYPKMRTNVRLVSSCED